MFKKYILILTALPFLEIFLKAFFQEDSKAWFSLVVYLSLGVKQILVLAFDSIKIYIFNKIYMFLYITLDMHTHIYIYTHINMYKTLK